MLAIENLSAGYGPLTALSGVTLKLEEKARVGVFGHNGAGKTTLLKCIVGEHAPSAGTVTFAGRPIEAGNVAGTVRSGIAYVPQGHNVFPNLSVEQNLNISGLLFDTSFSTRIYELFPILNARRAQPAGSMSGGEQQMLALGMALMTQPKWLLLDEPCTGPGADRSGQPFPANLAGRTRLSAAPVPPPVRCRWRRRPAGASSASRGRRPRWPRRPAPCSPAAPR